MKNKMNYMLYALIVFAISILIFTVLSFFNIQNTIAMDKEQGMNHQRMSNMQLTQFDTQLAKQFMDKDSDGRCDACGMDVNLCIQSGQLQCNMDPKSTIGVLGSAHIHADFKVFINGEPINFANEDYYMKSSFIHVDKSSNKEDSSGVLHMHATGVPLWMFFESIGGKFNQNCFAVGSGEFCSSANKTVKFYVNGEINNAFGDYVFKDSDKILISYGDISENMEEQLKFVTDFSRSH